MNETGPLGAETPKPRYDLSADEIATLEQGMLTEISQQFGEKEDLYALWIAPDSPYADVIRTYETKFWADMSEIMEPHESNSLFLALVDTRDGLNKTVHGFRVSGANRQSDDVSTVEAGQEDSDQTGLVLVDDIINSGQDFTAAEFRDYYSARGFDLSKFITVETNFRIEKAPKYNGLPTSQVGYIAVFELCSRRGISDNELAIIAALNQLAIGSLQAVGVEYEPIAGREDLRIPLTEGKFDPDYTAVAIPSSNQNLAIFGDLLGFAAPSMDLS